MTTNTLSLRTTDGKFTNFDIMIVSWVDRKIEVSATNQVLGQRLVSILSPTDVESQRRLSEFHDKLLSVMGRFNMTITAYTGLAALPKDVLDVDLTKQRVYLSLNTV